MRMKRLKRVELALMLLIMGSGSMEIGSWVQCGPAVVLGFIILVSGLMLAAEYFIRFKPVLDFDWWKDAWEPIDPEDPSIELVMEDEPETETE